MLDLTLRLIASLAVVVGLLLLLARLVGRRFSGRPGAAVQVLHRQPLSRTSSVAVVTVGSRVLVLGTTDHQVQLLTELDPEELEDTHLELVAGAVAEGDDDLVLELPQALRDEQPAPSLTPTAVRPASRPGARRAEKSAGSRRAPRTGTRATRPTRVQGVEGLDQGALAGSLLSTRTWRQAYAAATGKAS